jgi:predicted secreted acid phosphatase
MSNNLNCSNHKKLINLLLEQALAVKLNIVSFLQGWQTVPEECVGIVGAYMEGPQFKADSSGATTAAETFLQSVTLSGDGKDIVVFDIDETALSNLPYYRKHKYG